MWCVGFVLFCFSSFFWFCVYLISIVLGVFGFVLFCSVMDLLLLDAYSLRFILVALRRSRISGRWISVLTAILSLDKGCQPGFLEVVKCTKCPVFKVCRTCTSSKYSSRRRVLCFPAPLLLLFIGSIIHLCEKPTYLTPSSTIDSRDIHPTFVSDRETAGYNEHSHFPLALEIIHLHTQSRSTTHETHCWISQRSQWVVSDGVLSERDVARSGEGQSNRRGSRCDFGSLEG